MRSWKRIPREESFLYGMFGRRLVDVVTGGAPLGRIVPHLELKVAGIWQMAPGRVLISDTGIVTCPELGRCANPTTTPVSRYRVSLEADLYRPLYRLTDDGFEFDAFPYNDVVAPAQFTKIAPDAELVPAVSYPFPAGARVLRGVVVDAAGKEVRDALVYGQRQALGTLSDDQGTFALAMFVEPDGIPVTITANHRRTGRSGQIDITLPADLRRSQTISIR